ncbi:hypothetical protein DL770_004105 [Monosporascus sp. CRB-9-2]|nr:hypothetical protein DL770_004105 [Monosporascus sp. CRB-9-2]
MLPTSVRRVVSSAPQSPLFSNLASSSSRASSAALAYAYTPLCQQRRRYSSSKPSSPNDSPKGISDGQVTATPASSTKQSGEKRKRKANKDGSSNSQHKLPSVPSTQHVPHKSMALSTFFSLHRPMSVTHSFPKTVTDDFFAQIFAPPTKGSNANEVMSTLSDTVDQLEQPMQALNLDSQQDNGIPTDANGDHVKIEVRHADGSESNLYVQLNAMSGQFLPFRPPPAPQPESATEAAVTAREELAEAPAPEVRIYKAMFTLEETVDANGETRIVAHSPQIIEEDAVPRTFLERMALREIRRADAQKRSPGMHAISVRRQRKLKMKKKKYKKLMKRTRNERRKLDRV